MTAFATFLTENHEQGTMLLFKFGEKSPNLPAPDSAMFPIQRVRFPNFLEAHAIPAHKRNLPNKY